ncbi:MAG: hypothetical protein ACFFBZ_14870, partial [Promethearchaeota archaeon]
MNMSSKSNDQLRPLIIDIGSNTFRLGWAGDDFPDIIVPSVYVDINDYLFTSDVIDGLEDIFIDKENIENHLFGNDALKYQNILKIHEFKKENNFTILTKFFYYYYQQLEISEECRFKQPIIIITPFFMPELTQKKLKETFFDIFGFPSILFLSAKCCFNIFKSLVNTFWFISYLTVFVGANFASTFLLAGNFSINSSSGDAA